MILLTTTSYYNLLNLLKRSRFPQYILKKGKQVLKKKNFRSRLQVKFIEIFPIYTRNSQKLGFLVGCFTRQ